MHRGWISLHQRFGESHRLSIVLERLRLIAHLIERAVPFKIKSDEQLVVILVAIGTGSKDPERRRKSLQAPDLG